MSEAAGRMRISALFGVSGARVFARLAKLAGCLAALVCFVLLGATHAWAQQGAPLLRYTPPADTVHLGSGPPDDYSFSQFNGQIEFYPFRPFNGDIRSAFQTTVLRDWIDVQYQEQAYAAVPDFGSFSVPGADQVLTATFVENQGTIAKPHVRVLIIAGSQAAIVDYSSNTLQTLQMAMPALNAMAASLRVETARPPAPLSQAAGLAVAGLYMGQKQNYSTAMENVTGTITAVNALHFYLFSPDGRVYRAYNRLDVPGGDIARFDFVAAEQVDPENSGRFTVEGDKLVIQMGGPSPQSIIADLPRNGTITIEAVTYTRQ